MAADPAERLEVGESPSQARVLLLDDGELDRIGRMLDQLGVAYERLEGRSAGAEVPCPSELLISSGRRAFQMPRLVPPIQPSGPVWVCYHGQDFLPLREQLRGFGANYLVSSAVDQETLRLFLLQLLHRKRERRKERRLPMGTRVQCRVGSQLQDARLVDLSQHSCRALLDCKLEPGTPLRVRLPAALGAGSLLELPGSVLRSVPATAAQPSWSTAIVFDALPPEDTAQLRRILGGREIGTRVTPLAEHAGAERALEARGAAAAEPGEAAAAPGDRRAHARREYRRKVDILELSAKEDGAGALGFDLSPDGVRITQSPPLELGARLTLALYAGRREEPVVVSAVVAREIAQGEFGLHFESLSPQQAKELARLHSGLPALQSVEGATGATGSVVVARFVDAG